MERDLLKKVSLPRIFFQGVRGEMLEMGKRQFGSLRYPLNLSSGHEQVVEGLLIFAADDVNRRNFKGETALHCAAHAASVACIDRLLNMPDINPNLQVISRTFILKLA